MKKLYKNQKEALRAEVATLSNQLISKERELQTLREKTNEQSKPQVQKPRVNVKWFCKRCRVVAKGTVPQGVDIETCHCDCGGELLAVSRLPFDF
jgi:hypothetical protein